MLIDGQEHGGNNSCVAQVFVVADGINNGVYTVILPIQTVLVRYTWNRGILGALRSFWNDN